MSVPLRIEVEGLRDLRRELRKLSLTNDLRAVNRRVADLLVPPARQKAARSYPNLAGGVARVGSRGVASIRSQATASRAYLVSGKATIPWMGGGDFGSAGRYRQFPAKKDEGRFIYPTIREEQPRVIDEYWRELDTLTSAAFPEGSIK